MSPIILNCHHEQSTVHNVYSKYLKISITKVSDKMTYANSADPDQTDQDFTVCHSTKYFKTLLLKKQNLGQNSMELSVRNFRTFTVFFFMFCFLVC